MEFGAKYLTHNEQVVVIFMACYLAKIWESSVLRLSVAAALFGLIARCLLLGLHCALLVSISV